MPSQGTFTEASVDYDLKGVIESLKLSVLAKIGEKDSIGSLREKTKKVTGPGYILEEQGTISVGIVGAGVAGFYDILEAAGGERLRGHLYTHHLSDEEHDYYDVGAMRFQNNTIMKTSASLMRQTGKYLADTLPRTFQLFQYIGITQESKPGLIPYYSKDELDECPAYINDIMIRGNVWDPEKKANDPYEVNKGLPEKGQIPPELLKTNPSDLVSAALKIFTVVTKEKFKAAIAEEEEEEKKAFKSTVKD
ncbi:hypothetical protein QWA68_013645 [Fusarium oxysporum]|nr:hypothetical protein QWA68_013645 [Fusarium oxysporum]